MRAKIHELPSCASDPSSVHYSLQRAPRSVCRPQPKMKHWTLKTAWFLWSKTFPQAAWPAPAHPADSIIPRILLLLMGTQTHLLANICKQGAGRSRSSTLLADKDNLGRVCAPRFPFYLFRHSSLRKSRPVQCRCTPRCPACRFQPCQKHGLADLRALRLAAWLGAPRAGSLHSTVQHQDSQHLLQVWLAQHAARGSCTGGSRDMA